MKNLQNNNTAKVNANKNATAKSDIRPAVPNVKGAIVPNTNFENTKVDDVKNDEVVQAVAKVDEPKITPVVTTDPSNTEATKMEIKEEFKTVKPALSLEQTISLIEELGKKKALRDTYSSYIEDLDMFIVAQNDDDMGKDDNPSFKGCELVIRDGEGAIFKTNSASVIFGVVEFMKVRFNDRLAEVEAEIVIPY